MSPDRKKTINGHKVEKYYWAMRSIVYVDNELTQETFEEACERLEAWGQDGEKGGVRDRNPPPQDKDLI